MRGGGEEERRGEKRKGDREGESERAVNMTFKAHIYHFDLQRRGLCEILIF